MCHTRGFPGGAVAKNLPANAGATGYAGLIPVWGRSPGEGNGNPLEYPCLENSMDRGIWLATVHGVAKSRTRLSNFTIYYLSKDLGQNTFHFYLVNLQFLPVDSISTCSIQLINSA